MLEIWIVWVLIVKIGEGAQLGNYKEHVIGLTLNNLSVAGI